MTEFFIPTPQPAAADSSPVGDHVCAVILVGGKGTRLRPLTLSTPKPMLLTAGYPFVAHMLGRIKAAGITEVIMSTSYKAEVFTDYFGDGAEFGLHITYVEEEEPLGTGGGIRNVLDTVDALGCDTVMVFNGDVLGGTDLTQILDTHATHDAEVTLHLVQVQDPRAFGCVPTDGEGRVLEFLEKTMDPPTNQINAGTYVFSRDVIAQIPANRPVSVEREVFPRLLEERARVFGHVDAAYWRDMGTPEDFIEGSSDLVRGIAPSPILRGQQGESLAHGSAGIGAGAILIGGSVIGRGAEIGAGCRIDGSAIFDGAEVEAGAVVERSIIGKGAKIGPRARIRGAVIGDGAVVGARCELLDGIRIWPGVELPDNGIRFSTDV